MISRFCDCCGKEVKRNYVSERLEHFTIIGDANIQVKVIVGIKKGEKPAWNAGEICFKCLKKAINDYTEKEGEE